MRRSCTVLLTAACVLPALLGAPARAAQGPLRPEDYKATVRVACVGDSISRVGGTTSYPALLGKMLRRRYDVRNFGVTGATVLPKGRTPYRTTAQCRQATAFAPHAVVILLGTNDARQEPWPSGADLAAGLRALVEHFEKLEGKPRLWLCLPPSVFSRRVNSVSATTLDHRVLPQIRRVAAEKGLPIIDLHRTLRLFPECFPDGVHPNREGRIRIAQLVYAALTARTPPPASLFR